MISLSDDFGAQLHKHMRNLMVCSIPCSWIFYIPSYGFFHISILDCSLSFHHRHSYIKPMPSIKPPVIPVMKSTTKKNSMQYSSLVTLSLLLFLRPLFFAIRVNDIHIFIKSSPDRSHSALIDPLNEPQSISVFSLLCALCLLVLSRFKKKTSRWLNEFILTVNRNRGFRLRL